jgi:hypothetical protein
MENSRTIIWASALLAAASAIVAAIGLFTAGGPGPYPFETLRGATATIYGIGLYRYDNLLTGAGFRGNDAVTLFVGVPSLLGALWLYGRGSLKGTLLLAGVLTFFTYVYGSFAFGAAYNPLLMVYIAIFSASLFSLGAVTTQVDQSALAARVMATMPRRAIAFFMLVVAVVLLVVWLLLTWLPSVLAGDGTALVDSYTTVITYTIDLGIIVPFAILTAIRLFQRRPSGYLYAAIMLTLSWLMGATIAAATLAQIMAGYTYALGQLIGLVAPFVVLTGVGGWLSWRYFRNIHDEGRARLIAHADTHTHGVSVGKRNALP